MSKNYYLRFLLKNQADDFTFEVRKEEADRLDHFYQHHVIARDDSFFFWLRSTNGRSIIINLAEVQAVRFLWDPAQFPSDDIRGKEQVEILFRGRQKPLSEFAEAPDQLYDLFSNLQLGDAALENPYLLDIDGEVMQLNRHEIVWITAPTHLLDEGANMIMSEIELDRGSGSGTANLDDDKDDFPF
jgi:hypothetical protein